jgi:hypothetical protein
MLSFPRGCPALFGSKDPESVVLDNYRKAAEKAGWEYTGTQSSRRVEISNDAWTVEVEPYSGEEGLIELLVHRRRR